MGLNIAKIQHAGQEFTMAYAKVDNVNIDNENKFVTFDICIYTTKEEKILIKKIHNKTFRLNQGSDTLQQCYEYIKTTTDAIGERLSIFTEMAKKSIIQERKIHFEKLIKTIEGGDLAVLIGSTNN